jgi:hypothetical protein
MATHAERVGALGYNVPELQARLTPLDTMLLLMKIAMVKEEYAFALDCAKNCAPYVHPRLSMAMISHTTEAAKPDTLSDNQLQRLIHEATQLLADRSSVDMPLLETK